MEQAGGLALPIAHQERLLLGVSQRPTELVEKISFQVEGCVIQQFLSALHCHMELVGIKDHLSEGCVAEGQRPALFDPRSGGLSGGNVDLVLAAGRYRGSQLPHDVLLSHLVDEAAVVLHGHEVAAGGVDALLEDVAHLAEVGAEGRQHGLFILRTGAAGLLHCVEGRKRLVGQRRGGRAVQFSFDGMQVLHTGDLLSEVDDFGLHTVVGGTVLSGQGAVLGAVGVQEGLSLLPEIGALFAQFVDREHMITIFPCV